jgi:hypothetical protein
MVCRRSNITLAAKARTILFRHHVPSPPTMRTLFALLLATTALAQTPRPGVNYDEAKVGNQSTARFEAHHRRGVDENASP